jgi:hypothetical protein
MPPVWELVSMRLIRSFCIAASFCTVLTPAAFGFEGWAFVAPGGSTSGGSTTGTLHVGGGGEYVFNRGIGLGAEIGAVGPWNNFRSALGLLSLNGSYHFMRGAKLDPFVTGGYTLAFRSGTLNMGNYGAGLNYWLGDHLGVRAEFRDHVHVNRGANLHFWGVRFGVAFR